MLRFASVASRRTPLGLANLARSSRHLQPLRAYMQTRSPTVNLTRRRIELPHRAPVARANVAAMAPLARPYRTDANARPLMSKKTRMIVVYGFGCNKYPKEVEERHVKLLKNMNRSIVSDIDVMCNTTEPQSMTYDIWRRLLASKRILEPTKFVMRVMDAVCQALRRGEEVILVGHSYGGSVASRIAMFIGTALGGSCSASQTFNRRLISKLRVVTFGSIFIPPPETTRGVKVNHYVYGNDIAAFCHKQNTRCGYVKVLKPRPGFGPLKSHVNYDHLVTSIAQTGSINNAAIDRARRTNLVRVV